MLITEQNQPTLVVFIKPKDTLPSELPNKQGMSVVARFVFLSLIAER